MKIKNENKIQRTNVKEITFQHLFVHFVLLIATTILAMSITEMNMFYFVQVIERLFLTRLSYNEYGFKLAFNDLETVDDWWIFARTTFVESFAKLAVKNDPTFDGYACVTLPRLRQLRVRNETCDINDAFRNLYVTCYGEYSSDNEDLSCFQNRKYMTASEVGATSIRGMVATYGGGGYVEALSLNIEENRQTFDHLENNNWIDRGTRAVIIEFALFNAYSNLFCNIKLLTEVPSTGGILSFSAISPLKYSILGKGFLEYISVLLFYGLIIYYTNNLIVVVIKSGHSAILNSIWNFLDLTIILLGHVILVYIIWHTLHLKALLKNGAIRTHHFSLDVICQWYAFFTVTVGLSVFLVWIKVLKYVNLHIVMWQFSKTLQRSTQDLLGFAIMFSIVFVAYANLSVLLFASSQESFCNFRNALLSTMRMVLCDLDYTEIEEEYPILAPFFLLSYILLVFFVLMNMFLAILYDTYSEVKSELKGRELNTFKKDLTLIYENVKKLFGRRKRGSIQVYTPESSLKPARNRKTQRREEVEILDTLFEILADERCQEETEVLYKRVRALEESLNKLAVKVEDVLNEINKVPAKP